jgi:dephospho-CoA kinase
MAGGLAMIPAMIKVGLTGSIGMGKSTAARMFAAAGVPVFDADAVVHALYEPGAAGARAIAAAFPETAEPDGRVNRAALRAIVQNDPDAFARLEAIVHPLVAAERRAFLRRARRKDADVVVLDIPLLFETGGAGSVDAIVVVTAPEETQRQRVLSRPGMTKAAFEAIRARQTPDSEKCARADYVIDSSGSFADTRFQISTILRALKRRALRRTGRQRPESEHISWHARGHSRH